MVALLMGFPPLCDAAHPAKPTMAIVVKVNMHGVGLREGFPTISSPHPQHILMSPLGIKLRYVA
jgi:hypothetical protein